MLISIEILILTGAGVKAGKMNVLGRIGSNVTKLIGGEVKIRGRIAELRNKIAEEPVAIKRDAIRLQFRKLQDNLEVIHFITRNP